MSNFISTKEARKILGVTTPTLINWDKAGRVRTSRLPTGTRIYNKEDIYAIAGIDKINNIKRKICYCRVSSKKQMDDLGRQQNFFRNLYPTHELVSDIGSGINWKRKGLKTILEQSMSGNVSEVVVAHRDRLCRFAFELVEFIFTKNNVKLIVLDENDCKSKDTELADDIMSIVHVYSCRNMGRRRYKNVNKSEKDKNLSEYVTEENSEEVDRDVKICV